MKHTAKLTCLLYLMAFVSIDIHAGERWTFAVTPYLWNASVSGSLSDSGAGGEKPISPDYNFFSLSNLDDYLALQFEANKGRYGILFDSLRARYQDETGTMPNLVFGTDLGFIELSGRYQLHQNHDLDIVAGVRNAYIDIDLTFIPGNTRKRSFDWTDPLIGFRYQYRLGKKWYTKLRGDIGGFNVATQRVINVSADIVFKMNSHIGFVFGYRYLEIDFKQDDFLYDVSLDGLHAGATVYF